MQRVLEVYEIVAKDGKKSRVMVLEMEIERESGRRLFHLLFTSGERQYWFEKEEFGFVGVTPILPSSDLDLETVVETIKAFFPVSKTK